ncbi:MAG: glycosyltransferase [Rhodospirillales bacterium]|nr:glycosyltransferase [Rhodospirillales bacterium]
MPMRALVVCPDAPPDASTSAGGMRRLSLFLAAIRGIAEEIEMLFLVPEAYIRDTPDLDALSRQQSRFWNARIRVALAPLARRREGYLNHYVQGAFSVRNHPFFHAYTGAAATQAVATCLSRRPDFVFVQRLAAMVPILRQADLGMKLFFDLDDVEHKARLRAAWRQPRWPARYAYAAQSPAIHLAERQAARRSRAVFVCSEPDRRYLAKLGVPRLHVVPNAVALPEKIYRKVEARSVLFLGFFGHAPNVAAAERLIRHIWPRVRARAPDATLLIAGAQVEALASFSAPPEGVRMLGFVADLATLYVQSRVICCPILQGGGTRVKIIEAGAYGRPVVSTTIGAEGLDFRDGAEILLADSDHDIAEACVALLHDEARCRALGTAIQDKVHAGYDPEAISTRIAAIIERNL